MNRNVKKTNFWIQKGNENLVKYTYVRFQFYQDTTFKVFVKEPYLKSGGIETERSYEILPPK